MDAENELFDAACDLLDSAQRLTRSARAAAALQRAVPGTLGCVEATVGALCLTCDALTAHVAVPPRRALEDAVVALQVAESACRDARAAAAGHVAEPSSGGVP